MLRVLLAVLALAGAPAFAQTPLQRYQATITPAELAGHLYVYADDFMAGRDTGAPAQRFAARYLAGQYQAMGVAARGSGTAEGPYGLGGYLQPFALERSTLREMRVRATRGGTAILESTIRADSTEGVAFMPAYGAVTDASPARVVFVGTADGAALAALNLAGTYVLMLTGTATDPADQAATQARLAALGALGVRAVVLPVAPTRAALAPRVGDAFSGGGLALPDVAGAGAEDDLPPILLTGADVAQQMLEGTGTALDAASAPVDTGVMLSVDARRDIRTVQTENVVAVVPGTDLADEFVIISAHLDHIGVEADTTLADRINNGADDDGSGTVALLEIAEAFHQARLDGNGPRRSVLFLHVSGEEKGLLGSAHYADREPLVPLTQTVANLNIDMIGRQDPTYDGAANPYVYVIGGSLISTDLDATNTRVNAETGLGLDLSARFNSADDPNQFFRRSDHWNFGKNGIPFIFYFTGTHEDYHRPGDEADKIDYDRMATIARLVFGTAWEVANADARPGVSGTGFD